MIELADVIRDLREQIQLAQIDGADKDLKFELGPVEVELTVAVSSEDTGAAKVRFYVVEVGGSLKDSEVSTQKLKLTLTPRPTATALATTEGSASTTEQALSQALIYVTGRELAGER